MPLSNIDVLKQNKGYPLEKETSFIISNTIYLVALSTTYRSTYSNLFATHADKRIVVKFSSRTCQACQMLQQKMRQYVHRHHAHPSVSGSDESNKHDDAVVIFADVSVTKQAHAEQPMHPLTAFVTGQLKVTRIPLVQFYAPANKRSMASGKHHHRLVDTFTCGTTTSADSSSATKACSWTEFKDKLDRFEKKYKNTQTSAASSTTARHPPWGQRIRNLFSSSS